MSDRPPSEFVLQRQGPPIIRPSHLFSLIIVLAAVSLVALFALDSYFVVEPTEMAGVRRLGQVVTAKPLGPGPHFKLPLTLLEGTNSVPLLSLQPGEASEKK